MVEIELAKKNLEYIKEMCEDALNEYDFNIEHRLYWSICRQANNIQLYASEIDAWIRMLNLLEKRE